MISRKEKLAKTIATAVIELVERVGGPVTLAQIECEVSGFAERPDSAEAWSYVTGFGDEDGILIWDGMTEEGCAGLRSVLLERRVAVQMTPAALYLLEGRCPLDHKWVPVSLLPARMANLETPRLLIRGSQDVLDQAMVRAAAEGVSGFRLLHPTSQLCGN
jgi:hypothetical protein